MNYILFDDSLRLSLLPFTHTRPIADIRCGILTMRERWERLLNTQTSTLTSAHLQEAFPLKKEDDSVLINARVFGTPALATAISDLATGEKLVYEQTIIAARLKVGNDIAIEAIDNLTTKSTNISVRQLQIVTDIFSQNEQSITEDFELVTDGLSSTDAPEGVTLVNEDNVFIHPDAKIGAGVIINASKGPVYIAAGAEIMEGCLIRGPFALCEKSTLNMGAKIYGGTTVGPVCKVGGEINNVVFFANSNKGHDGFLGNSVIGEWCNLGADTNCSNLKNNYDEVKIWDEARMKSVKTGLTFCGLLMGDHSKCGINTMFNTGTVVGISCNIWGGGFPEKFIPSFSWGGSEGMTTYSFDRAVDTANRMMGRRSRSLTEAEKSILKQVFDTTENQRALLHHSAS